MKKCPSCSRTYEDDALSFCLEDGSPLLSVGGSSQPASFDPNATLQYNPARATDPPPQQIYHSGQTPVQPQPMPTPSWTPMPPAGAVGRQPQKKSKALFWIIGVVAALVVLGIGGIVLIVVLAGMAANTNNSNANNSDRPTGSPINANNSNAKSANRNSADSSSKNYVIQDDFSSASWWTGSNLYGKAEYVNGEYQLSAGGYRGYVVVYAPKKDAYHTENATTRATTRSVTGTSPSLGYGLTIYSEMKNDVLEDYGFLIRTDESPAFRVVLHQAGKETVLVNWTRSSLIRTGTSPNQLEVRAKDDQLAFYINGQYATSVTDSVGYKHGLVGFYSSDTAPVAFDDLEIYK